MNAKAEATQGQPSAGQQRGDVPEADSIKLKEASASFLVEREAKGREAAGQLVTQVALIGTFLGAFSLLNDQGKAAVVQSDSTYIAIGAAAVAVICALCSYLLLPSKLPALGQITLLQNFWNDRVRVRRLWLLASTLAIVVGLVSAVAAFSNARTGMQDLPSGALTSKAVPAESGLGTVEVSAVWDGLRPGSAVVLCVHRGDDDLLAATAGSADPDGKVSIALVAALGIAAPEELRASSAPVGSPPVDASALCAEKFSSTYRISGSLFPG